LILPFPGMFGALYQNDRPTENASEKKSLDSLSEKCGHAGDLELLQKASDRMKYALVAPNLLLRWTR
jgi:hypothetical protein